MRHSSAGISTLSLANRAAGSLSGGSQCCTKESQLLSSHATAVLKRLCAAQRLSLRTMEKFSVPTCQFSAYAAAVHLRVKHYISLLDTCEAVP